MTDFEKVKAAIPRLSNEELAKLNFEIFVEVSERASKETGKDIETLVEEALTRKSI